MTNIFLNSYQQAENKLTYNFLAVLELINSKSFSEFIVGQSLPDKPLMNIKTVYGGGESNPDGSFEVRKLNGESCTIFFENKTKRRGLSISQLQSHLNWLNEGDLLLVVTPRKSDIELIRQINDPRIKFYTWSEIANQLKLENNKIVDQFLIYGKLSGEFEEMGDIDSSDINFYCRYLKSNFDKKLTNILTSFYHEVDLEKFGFNLNSNKRYNEQWGRKGVEFLQNTDYGYNENSKNTYSQFITIAFYHDTEDHGIPFKNDQPEICVFFDIAPDRKFLLKDDPEFKNILNELNKIGFETNLFEEISTNPWRLFFYRKPISEFKKLSTLEIIEFTNDVFSKLISVDIWSHKYFNELK